MTLTRDPETRHRHRCTNWLSVDGSEFQCSNTFCNEKGRHNGPHHHFGKDANGVPFRITWGGPGLPPVSPPFEAGT